MTDEQKQEAELSFVPPPYLSGLLSETVFGTPLVGSFFFDKWSRKSHMVPHKRSLFWRVGRTMFASAWRTVERIGIRMDWLEQGWDGEYGINPSNTRYVRVWDETEVEHQARIADLPDTFTFRKSAP